MYIYIYIYIYNRGHDAAVRGPQAGPGGRAAARDALPGALGRDEARRSIELMHVSLGQIILVCCVVLHGFT